jgi:hypothetical protein
MAFNYMLPFRAAQGLLCIIILGLMAYVVNDWAGAQVGSPAEANYLLFCSVWTILALAYLTIAPVRFETAAHKFGILAAEFLTMIFWFAGFIALAVFLTGTRCYHWGPCRAAKAATVFAAFEWYVARVLEIAFSKANYFSGFCLQELSSWLRSTSGAPEIPPTANTTQTWRSTQASRGQIVDFLWRRDSFEPICFPHRCRRRCEFHKVEIKTERQFYSTKAPDRL